MVKVAVVEVVYTPTPPSVEVAVLPVMLVLSFMVNVPSTTYTPPPVPLSRSVALLLVTLALPFMVKVPPLTYTPPPPLVAVLSVMVPPYMLNLLFVPVTHTPPPRCVVVLPVMVPPYILKVPPLSTFTPLPEPSLVCLTLPILPLQSVRVSVLSASTRNTG